MKGIIRNAMLDHAKRELPKESCGLLVNVGGETKYIECRNMAEKDDYFVMNPADYAEADAMGEIIAVCHSHPNASAKPSEADRVACEASGLPWYIIGLPVGDIEYIQPEGYKAPLIGRPFFHGVLDCYSLIRDWYKLERGIDLPDGQPRVNEWWTKGQNLYLENYERAGFKRIEPSELAIGDIILMQVMSSVPNHGAVLVRDNIILHHLHGGLSCEAVYGGYWRKHSTHFLRYHGN